jgi:chitinase
MKRFCAIIFVCVQMLLTTAYSSSVVAVYYENWSQYRQPSGGRTNFFPNMIDPTIMTDLYYAFAYFGFVTKSIDPDNPHLTGDYTIQPVEWNDVSVLYPQVMALKQQNPNLRVHLSIGGWAFNDPNDPNGAGEYTYKLFSEMVASKDNRDQFINSAIAYAHQYGFDGIDIDWEYPGDTTRGGTDADFDNYVTFLSECYTACHNASPSLMLSYASPAIVPSGVNEKYHQDPSLFFKWLADCSQYLDHINVMCYDYHGVFDNPQITGVNAPLNHDTDPTSTMFDAQTIDNYINNGVDANKIVMGMPTYGHSYGGVTGLSDTDNGPGKPFTSAGAAGPSTATPGLLAYFEVSDMIANKELTFGTDSLTSTAYGYNITTGEWVSFDTPDTIALKVQLIQSKNLLGGMFWSVDDDEYAWGDKYPNIRAAASLMGQ